MMKRILSLLLIAVLLAFAIPALAEEDAHKAFAVQYATDLMGGQKNEELYAMFTDAVKAQLPRETFDGVWGQIASMFGDFQGFGSFSVREAQGYETCFLTLDMSKQDLLMQLTLDPSGKVAGFFITQAPVQQDAAAEQAELPAGIVEEDISVGEGEWALGGTLTLPETGSNFPAVVLVQGSGASDRNEAVGGTKFFRDIAWAFAQKGIAVLRYDKRTFAHSDLFTKEVQLSFTVKEETVDDAVLAGKLLKADARINGSKIFLLGHSMGAMLGSRIAAQGEGLFAGMILVSGTPLLLTDIIIAQNEDVLSKLTVEQQAQQQPLLDAEIEKVNALYQMTPEEAKQETVFGLPGYYFYEMKQYDAPALLLDLKLPTLILQGGEDFQVSVENGLDAWEKALGAPDFVTYKLYPELNHLMMKYTGDPALQYTLQEYNTPANMDGTVASDMINWILAH